MLGLIRCISIGRDRIYQLGQIGYAAVLMFNMVRRYCIVGLLGDGS